MANAVGITNENVIQFLEDYNFWELVWNVIYRGRDTDNMNENKTLPFLQYYSIMEAGKVVFYCTTLKADGTTFPHNSKEQNELDKTTIDEYKNKVYIDGNLVDAANISSLDSPFSFDTETDGETNSFSKILLVGSALALILLILKSRKS